MGFYLGIDGGGTKTKFVLGDEASILAEATSAGSNLLRIGEASVRGALVAGVVEVCAAAGVQASQITRTVAGIAGSSNEKVREALTTILREQVGGEIEVDGDMVIAHEAALKGAPGVLVNAGTGSIAYGRNMAGATARAGGWGFAISDEGSGYWIGRVALAAAMRLHDAGESDGYPHHLMAALGANEVAELAALPASRSLSELFPIVVEMANLGDQTAQQILRNAGEELALLAKTVVHRLFADEAGVAIAAMGGVFRVSAIVFESFAKGLRDEGLRAKVSLADADAAMGALAMARRARS